MKEMNVKGKLFGEIIAKINIQMLYRCPPLENLYYYIIYKFLALFYGAQNKITTFTLVCIKRRLKGGLRVYINFDVLCRNYAH